MYDSLVERRPIAPLTAAEAWKPQFDDNDSDNRIETILLKVDDKQQLIINDESRMRHSSMLLPIERQRDATSNATNITFEGGESILLIGDEQRILDTTGIDDEQHQYASTYHYGFHHKISEFITPSPNRIIDDESSPIQQQQPSEAFALSPTIDRNMMTQPSTKTVQSHTIHETIISRETFLR